MDLSSIHSKVEQSWKICFQISNLLFLVSKGCQIGESLSFWSKTFFSNDCYFHLIVTFSDMESWKKNFRINISFIALKTCFVSNFSKTKRIYIEKGMLQANSNECRNKLSEFLYVFLFFQNFLRVYKFLEIWKKCNEPLWFQQKTFSSIFESFFHFITFSEKTKYCVTYNSGSYDNMICVDLSFFAF